MRKIWFASLSGLCLSLAVGCQTVAPSAPATESAASFELIESAARIEQDIVYLADDRLQGREAGSEGYDLAAAYVAEQFKNIGLQPAGDDNSWYQTVPLRASRRDLDKASLSLTVDGSTTDLEHLKDYLIGLPANGLDTEVSSELVFVGYGIDAPEFGINDYEGLDVDGKVVVVLLGTSTDMPSEVAAHYNSGRTRRELAAANGAIGMLSVYDQAAKERFPWDRVKGSASRSSMSWVRADGTTFSSAPGIKVTATLSPDMGERLFEGADLSYEEVLDQAADKGTRPQGFQLPASVTIKAGAIAEDVTSPNVLAVLPGKDPDLKDEYVVISAHLDHTGVRDSDDPDADVINNGALDNASGIATMLEAARMLKELSETGKEPRRSILFAAVTAEEKGLLGSEYFAYQPTVDADSIVANVNLDMPLITYPFVDVIAFGADRSSLGDIVRSAAAKMDVALIPDPIPQMSIFTRSDHYRFVQQGVPSVFLFLGFGNGGEEEFNDFMSKRYHRPGDDLAQELDFEQGARFAKLNYLVIKSVANADKRPSWNEGDFFGELYGK